MQCNALDRYKLTDIKSVRLCVLTFPFVHHSDQFLSDLPLIQNAGRICNNEDQVRWPITPEVVNAHARLSTHVSLRLV